jgi:hypothetical protein
MHNRTHENHISLVDCMASSGSVPVIAASAPGATSASVADKWLSKWIGPEGTFLQLDGGNGKYEITIGNLDAPRTFHGNAADYVRVRTQWCERVYSRNEWR